MRSIHILRWVVAVSLLLALPVLGQQQKPVSDRTEAAEPETPATSSLPAEGNQALGPRLVKFSGVLTEFVRNSASSSVEMTFAVYKDEVGGEALWTETQNVEVDKEGRYTVLLGAAQPDGVPVELFPAGEPRWLGVEIRGKAPQSRTLLVSVPYALKALDAEKLSGKSLSDFVLSDSLVTRFAGWSKARESLRTKQLRPGRRSQVKPEQITRRRLRQPRRGRRFRRVPSAGQTPHRSCQYGRMAAVMDCMHRPPPAPVTAPWLGVATSNSTSNNQNGVIGSRSTHGRRREQLWKAV